MPKTLTFRQIIGRNIEKRRLAQNMSHALLAGLSEAGADEIKAYESGERRPNIERLWLMAKALDCSVDDLLPPR